MKNNTAPTTPTTFGEFLRALRTARGMGLVELAHAAGIDPGLLSRIERGQRNAPNLLMIRRIVKPLGVDQDSAEFRDLYAFTGRRIMTSDELWQVIREESQDPPPVVRCETLAEMLGAVVEHAIHAGATQVVVQDREGVLKLFKVPETEVTQSNTNDSEESQSNQ
jgi:transcriptional regulator with XRE-family HTH domain